MSGNLRAASREVGELWGVQPANPAAGTDWTYTLPAGYVYRLQSLYYEYTTAVGGIAHLHYLYLWDAALGVVWRKWNLAVMNSMGTYTLLWLRYFSKVDTTGLLRKQFLPCMDLPGGFTIGGVTTLLNPADQFANVYLYGTRLRDV